MKYHNSFYAPSITVLAADKQHQLTSVTLKKGEGTLTKAEFDAIKDSPSIIGYVEDGYLDFPACPEMQERYRTRHEERLARERELWGEQEERLNQPEQDLDALTALVGQQAQELADAKAFNADLVKANADQAERTKKLEEQVAALLEASKAKPAEAPKAEPAAKPAPATPPAAPAAPAPVAAPIMPPPPGE